MKYATVFAAMAVVAVAQDTTQNPLESIYSVAASVVSSYESAYTTTDAQLESALSDASSQIAAATSALGNDPSASEVYASIASQYEPILSMATASLNALNSMTADGGAISSALSSGIESITSGASSASNAITSAASSRSSSSSHSSATAASTSNPANNMQVGAMGAIGAAVLGLAAFL